MARTRDGSCATCASASGLGRVGLLRPRQPGHDTGASRAPAARRARELARRRRGPSTRARASSCDRRPRERGCERARARVTDDAPRRAAVERSKRGTGPSARSSTTRAQPVGRDQVGTARPRAPTAETNVRRVRACARGARMREATTGRIATQARWGKLTSAAAGTSVEVRARSAVRPARRGRRLRRSQARPRSSRGPSAPSSCKRAGEPGERLSPRRLRSFDAQSLQRHVNAYERGPLRASARAPTAWRARSSQRSTTRRPRGAQLVDRLRVRRPVGCAATTRALGRDAPSYPPAAEAERLRLPVHS